MSVNGVAARVRLPLALPPYAAVASIFRAAAII